MKKAKTPEELGLTLQEYAALIGVRGLLATKQLTYVSERRAVDEHNHFNMCHWIKKGWTECAPCGSIMCIGGSMDWLMGKPIVQGSNFYTRQHDKPIHALFFPEELNVGLWNKIKPKHAVQAIDNFLTTGKPKWEEVMDNG